jgi:hypothetical protein
MELDASRIQPGAKVYAHHYDGQHRPDTGQFVGMVVEVLERDGVHYLRIQPALDHDDDLYLPLAAVQQAVGDQVHLNLSPEDLAGRVWHLPPGPV